MVSSSTKPIETGRTAPADLDVAAEAVLAVSRGLVDLGACVDRSFVKLSQSISSFSQARDGDDHILAVENFLRDLVGALDLLELERIVRLKHEVKAQARCFGAL